MLAFMTSQLLKFHDEFILQFSRFIQPDAIAIANHYFYNYSIFAMDF
jgi:hypothetical protein